MNGETVTSWFHTSTPYNRDDVSNGSLTEKPQSYHNLLSSDSGSIISSEEFKVASEIIECGLIPTVGFVGIPANVINMVVFFRRTPWDKMNLCLFSLAFVDLMYLLCMSVSTVSCPAAVLPNSVTAQILKWNIFKFTLNFRYAFMYSSGTLTAIIATERCICVVWPLKSASIFTTKTMACMILVMTVVLNLLCVPYAIRLYVGLETDDTGNVTVIVKNTDLFVAHKLTLQIIESTILPGISFLTFIVVFFVTVVTVRKLRTAMDWRQKTSGHVMDNRQLTLVKILVTISCAYIACSLPNIMLAITRFLVADFSNVGQYKNMFFITHRGRLVLFMANSSINIVIYYKQSSRFRKELHAYILRLK